MKYYSTSGNYNGSDDDDDDDYIESISPDEAQQIGQGKYNDEFQGSETLDDSELDRPIGSKKEQKRKLKDDKRKRSEERSAKLLGKSSLLRTMVSTGVPQIYMMFNANITNISLVYIGRAFSVDYKVSQWIPLLFQMAAGIFGVLASPMMVKRGPGFIMKMAWIINLVSDIAIAASPSIYLLFIVRFTCGVGSSFAVGSQAFLQRLMASQDTLRKLFSVQSIISGAFAVVALLATSFVLDLPGGEGWRYVYAVLAAIDLLTVIATQTLIPKTPTFGEKKPFDIIGFLMFMSMIVSFLMFTTSFSQDWPYWVTIILGCYVLLILPVFGFFELKKAKQPIINLRLIKGRNPIMFIIITACTFGVTFGVDYITPYACNIGFKLKPIITSTVVATMYVAVSLINLILAKALKKIVSKYLFVFGMTVLAIGFVCDGLGCYFSILAVCYVGMALMGVGFGCSITSIMNFLQKVGGKNVAVFSALFLTSQTTGQGLFISLFTIVWENFQKVFFNESKYDPVNGPTDGTYEKQYVKAIGCTIFVFSGFFLIIALSTLLIRPFSVERGQIGFRERELPHNTELNTIVQQADIQCAELVPVEISSSRVSSWKQSSLEEESF